MPLSPEALEGLEQQQPTSVTVRLADVAPISGLIAACTRLCVAVPHEAVEALPDDAVDAFTQIQSILWRLEHAQPERPT
jgi:hypothetical protein